MSDVGETSCDVVEQVHAAFAHFAVGRAPGGHLHEDHEVFWFASDIPHSNANGVLNTHWDTSLSPAALRERIAATLAPFEARQTPASWLVWPSTRPADLGRALADYGLQHEGDEPAMVCDLSVAPAPQRPVSRLRIERVCDDATFARWADVCVATFAPTDEAAALFRRVAAVVGYDEPVTNYLGWLDGQPVATATRFAAGGAAGIFNVTTLAHARGKGIGAAITAVAIDDARRIGYRSAILLSSPMGYRIYRRLGFEKRCTVSMYAWAPPKPH